MWIAIYYLKSILHHHIINVSFYSDEFKAIRNDDKLNADDIGFPNQDERISGLIEIPTGYELIGLETQIGYLPLGD